MKSDTGKQHPMETTSLLSLPSPHSTDGPVNLGLAANGHSSSILSLGNLENYDEVHRQQETKTPQDVESQNAKLKRRNSIKKAKPKVGRWHAVILLLFTCIFSVSLVSLLNPNIRRTDGPLLLGEREGQPQPFSLMHPVIDLGITNLSRGEATSPPRRLFHSLRSSGSEQGDALPTSAWYQNLLLSHGEPTNLHRAYSIPYLVGLVGLIPGLTLHSNFLVPTSRVVQLANNEVFGLTIGAAGGIYKKSQEKLSHQYTVTSPTELGVTLHWDVMRMSSSLVRGMAYGTMTYEEHKFNHIEDRILFPTIASHIAFGKPPLADGATHMKCDDKESRTLVESEVEIYFEESDFTWLVFFSEPVWLQCSGNNVAAPAFLQVVDVVDKLAVNPLVIRAALADPCTNGKLQTYCKGSMTEKEKKGYSSILRRYVANIPGRNTAVKYQVLQEENKATINLDWNTQSISAAKTTNSNGTLQMEEDQTSLEILHFALPHHLDAMDNSNLPNERYCLPTLIGPACAIVGAELTMTEELPDVSFRAKRPIPASFISAIGDTLVEDIQYSLPPFFERGAGDTYFSGKMLAKLGRIALVAEELTELCGKFFSRQYHAVCKNATLPTRQEMDHAIDRLESSVEIWINGSAETPFIYDGAWGGLVSCGCHFNGDGCDNAVPNCPAFSDQGLNFGNGFYNDQHFHYGYHIYAASIVAHFRPKWGKKYWEQVLLLVRSIANPSREDKAFPLFRHKDWYQGNSWASGVPLPPYLNGKNQESSSEAIAAYEGVALYGKVMQGAWGKGMPSKANIAKDIMEVGQVLAATELRSARKYWHVRQNDPEERIYPEEYTENVVGILWQTMAQFGTWFGTANYLPYGIQLLPLTPISEERDELAWMNEMYYPFSESCAAQFQCTESGWGVLQLAVLATVGYAEEAARRVKLLPNESFTNAAGNGHSRSNTLWYIATRPVIDAPIPLVETDIRGADEKRPAPVFKLTDCHAPTTCTDAILDRHAGAFKCRERITWLIEEKKKSQWEACALVAGVEYPQSCGLCDPSNEAENARKKKSQSSDKNAESAQPKCPPCTDDECYSQLNRCPLFDQTFVCTAGTNAFGCSGQPWDTEEDCDACCEMTNCQSLKDNEAEKVTKDGSFLDTPACPPCPKKVCYGELNLCPIHTAPYLCLDGDSIGGCSSHPWDVSSGRSTCSECCEITPNC